MAHRRP